MVKRMLIDATHPEETRVVVVNGTRLEELDVETSTKRQLKGNIYLAKVVRVEPSLQAAFVEYGGNRHGFLAFSEIHPDYFQIPVADRQALLAAQKAEDAREHNGHDHAEHDAEPVAEASGESDGTVEEVAKPTQVEVVGGDEAREQDVERRRAKLLRNYKIQEVIKRRQIMLVQVVKEERGNKGAALTTYLSLAGRYCVLMPNTARGGGVSRKIINANDRRRLKSIASELEIPDGMAVIVRTAGSERSKTEIKRDYEYLLRMWDNVRELTLKSTAPSLVYEEASLIKRSIRDLYSRDIDEVQVEGDEGYRLAKDYMRMLTPSHAKKVQPYKDPVMPMFHRYQVETQLDAMHSPTVQLKSGGYIVISQTEALVAIDVNSGRATKERHIEETALKTNLEAADEVARQLRLRDLAGLIVIDFIDMEENRNNHAVERRLKDALKHDRARIQVGKISAFGLLELSRQRLRPSLQETTFSPCPHCAGTGLIRSVESAAVHVLRAIEEEGIRRRSSEVTVYVPSAIALYILNQKREALAAIEERYQFRVFLLGDDELIPPNFRMDRVKSDLPPVDLRPAPIAMIAPVVEEEDEVEDEAEEEEAEAESEAEARDEKRADGEAGETNGDRKRRRRRRRKRKGGEGQPSQDLATQGSDESGEGEADGEGEDEGESEGEGADERTARPGETEEEFERRKRRRGRRGGRRRRRNREDGDNAAPVPGPIDAPPQLVSNPDAVADVFAAAEAAEEAAMAARAAGVTVSEPAVETEAKPKRARSRRKAEPAAAPADAEAVVEAAAPAAVQAEAEVVAAEDAPKPKRSRKKAEPAVAAEPAEKAKPKARAKAAPKAKAEKAESAEAKPKASRSRKKAEPVAVEPTPEPEPVAVAPVPEPAAEEAPAPVVVETPEDPASPPKRGWWNRLLS